MNDEQPLDGAQEQLLRRMQAADPAPTPAADSRTADLVEATMNTTPVEPTTRRRWAPALAAAAAITLIGGGAYAILGGKDASRVSPEATVTTLAMPAGGGTSIGNCIQFEVRYLREMPVALSGTATDVGDGTITLAVDRWYKGGDADVVRLANYDPALVSLDGFAFVQGERYLIAASDGTVNFCGFSAPWSQQLANSYDEAFGS